ncbi:MAG: IS200/IS605 family element transposase accessory protein TnpB [Deltaproteobacteria bacterium]|nr:IS200/IS605 family element transposase accessory protein TnpB [Deltaproteobacteria bacterium]
MKLAHKITLDPTPAQAQFFARAAGTARFVWNWALAQWTTQYRAGTKPNGYALKKQFNAIKREQCPWLLEVHRDASAQPFAYLQRAFERFFQGETHRPTCKKKGCHDSVYVANDKLKVEGLSVTLPKVGRVRMREAVRFAGKICGATVSREAERWLIAFQIEVGEYRRDHLGDGVTGADLGVKDLVTLASGEKLPGPKALAAARTRLRRLSRRLSRKQRGSCNRRKAARRLARWQQRSKHLRQDSAHKLTTRLCRENQTVVIEALAVKGMVRDPHLARALSEAGFGEVRRQLTYKAVLFGTRVVVADRWFPSSKRCAVCGVVKETLTLNERLFRCQACRAVMDRDVNAGRNLQQLGRATPEVTPVERPALAGAAAQVKLDSLKQELDGAHLCARKG